MKNHTLQLFSKQITVGMVLEYDGCLVSARTVDMPLKSAVNYQPIPVADLAIVPIVPWNPPFWLVTTCSYST